MGSFNIWQSGSDWKTITLLAAQTAYIYTHKTGVEWGGAIYRTGVGDNYAFYMGSGTDSDVAVGDLQKLKQLPGLHLIHAHLDLTRPGHNGSGNAGEDDFNGSLQRGSAIDFLITPSGAILEYRGIARPDGSLDLDASQRSIRIIGSVSSGIIVNTP